MPEGTIILLRPNRDDGRGFGLIAPSDGGPELFFAGDSMEGALQSLRRRLQTLRQPAADRSTPFDRLSVGQRVTFALTNGVRRAGRACAEHVCPLGA